jgi:hypothetical protein
MRKRIAFEVAMSSGVVVGGEKKSKKKYHPSGFKTGR